MGMKDWEKYLSDEMLDWKSMFIFLIDEGHMYNMLKEMINQGILGDLNSDEMFDLIDYLENQLRAS